jgi:hypothetical protein
MDALSLSGQVNWERARMRRATGIALGLGNQVLFAVTVWFLFWFLKGGEPPQTGRASLTFDWLLSVLFVIPHSLLLLPSVRQRITNRLPEAFYGTLFCAVTCLSLWVVFAFWQSSAVVLWHFTGLSRDAVQGGFYMSWIALLYSLSLTGFGYQTGWTPWLYWFRGQHLPMRKFEPRGAYLWLRHPVYLSFLGLVWFVPAMTADRAVLTATWTTYIFFGSWLKDRRLVNYLGDRYLRYQSLVPGYPGMIVGPLARIPLDSPLEECPRAVPVPDTQRRVESRNAA